MTLTTRKYFNLLSTIRRRLVEDAEAEQARAADDLYARLESIEWQKWLDTVSAVLNNGSFTPKNRAEQIINLVHALEDLGDEEDDDYETVDGQDQVPTGRAKVDLTPTT